MPTDHSPSAWQPNTDLLPFDLEAIKKDVEAGNSAKKSKALWEAYVVAAKGHDLAYFKELLQNHEKAIQDDEAAKEAKREEKAEKAKKAAKRKSSAAVDTEDVEMEDGDDTAAASAKKAKPSKKRKKDADSEGDEEKVSELHPKHSHSELISLIACKDSQDYAQAYHEEEASYGN